MDESSAEDESVKRKERLQAESSDEDKEDEAHVDNSGLDKRAIELSQDDRSKKFKYGIIYLSYIPDGLNVSRLREIMAHFGEIGRIYLEPEESNATSKRRRYTEGWVEFKKKRVAKLVAETLNGVPLQYGKKHSRLAGQIWSIKYLHKFKWCHLTEQLAHDKAVKDQKRRFELSQTKKQVDFYQKMTERSKLLKKKRSQANPDPKESNKVKALQSRQNKPKGQGEELSVPVSEDLLSSIFKKVA